MTTITGKENITKHLIPRAARITAFCAAASCISFLAILSYVNIFHGSVYQIQPRISYHLADLMMISIILYVAARFLYHLRLLIPQTLPGSTRVAQITRALLDLRFVPEYIFIPAFIAMATQPHHPAFGHMANTLLITGIAAASVVASHQAVFYPARLQRKKMG